MFRAGNPCCSNLNIQMVFRCRSPALAHVDHVGLRHMAMAECVLRPNLSGVSCLSSWTWTVVGSLLYLPSATAYRVVALSYSVLLPSGTLST
jgi:hypothetical protein